MAEGAVTEPVLIARIRPGVPMVVGEGKESENTLDVQDNNVALNYEIDDGYFKSFSLDFSTVLGQSSSQEETYETVEPLVTSVGNGYQAAIISYGVTRSGKSYTLLGTRDNPGIMPRAIRQLFARIEEYNDDMEKAQEMERTEATNISFTSVMLDDDEEFEELEIPKSSISVRVFQMWRDRFWQLTESGPLEFTSSQIYAMTILAKTQGVECHTADELVSEMDVLMSKAFKGPAGVNTRSHFLIVLECNIVKKWDGPGGYEVLQGVLVGCDLGGLSRLNNIKNKEEKEDARGLNTSLFMMGRVVEALAKRKINSSTFQSSTLTRILELALGGSSALGVILNLTGEPGPITKEETSVLQFGAYVKALKLKPRRKVRGMTKEDFDRILARLEAEITLIRRKIERYKKRIAQFDQDCKDHEKKVKELNKEIAKLNKKLEQVIKKKKKMWEEVAKLEEERVDHNERLEFLKHVEERIEELKKLRQEIPNLNQMIEKTQQRRDMAMRECDDLRSSVTEKENECDEIEEKINLYNSSLEQFLADKAEKDKKRREHEERKAQRAERRRIRAERRKKRADAGLPPRPKPSELKKVENASPDPDAGAPKKEPTAVDAS